MLSDNRSSLRWTETLPQTLILLNVWASGLQTPNQYLVSYKDFSTIIYRNSTSLTSERMSFTFAHQMNAPLTSRFFCCLTIFYELATHLNLDYAIRSPYYRKPRGQTLLTRLETTIIQISWPTQWPSASHKAG